MVCYAISDLHGQLDGLDPKDADLVLIAGDFAPLDRMDFIGIYNQVEWLRLKFFPWCAAYPKAQFRMIPGNHDLFALEQHLLDGIKWPVNVKMLVDEADEVAGVRIYGTPWIPHFNGVWAFEASPSGEELDRAFRALPDNLDILLTHTPPLIRHQKVDVSIDNNSPHLGSVELTDALNWAQPRYVLCGHIHSGDHRPCVMKYESGGRTTTVRNVSRLNEEYRIAYEPFVFEL